MFHCLILPALLFLLSANTCASSGAVAKNQAVADAARARWSSGPHAGWLSRILPPAVTASSVPEPDSRGAQLLSRYCVQCHHLPSPAMHHPDKWPKIVDRMVVRMRGQGNRGALMKHMMGGVEAPDEEEVHMLIGYLRRNAQMPINRARYPDLDTEGRSFRDACDQCHALPEPSSRTADEWRRVVRRMQDNMGWMNRVEGSRPIAGEPQLRPRDILDYLERNARQPRGSRPARIRSVRSRRADDR
jgi:cytochrome c5